MSEPRYLTKSRFKLALECPTKLFYTKKQEYLNKRSEDSFLLALAEGGFQVGELAKCYFPGGVEIEAQKYDVALSQTNEILLAETTVIYEAAVNFADYFIFIDVLVKRGDHFDLIEVKSKSFDPANESFTNKNGTISSKWAPYLFDIAFQKHVLCKAFPDQTVSAYLMLADKSAQCPSDGLNQKFRIGAGSDGHKRALISNKITDADLSSPILCKINVDEICEQIYKTADGNDEFGRSFIERAAFYADHYSRNEKIVSQPSGICRKCEFRATDKERADGHRSGFHECWSETLGWTKEDFNDPTILEIWNYHYTRKNKRFSERRLKLNEIVEEDISPKSDDMPGLSQSQRQWLQVQKVQNRDTEAWLDKAALSDEIRSWEFPLHFIDFETSMAAIPFNRGRRPYEAIAFQFSHHLVHEDGRVIHQGEFLNAEPGQFPNYDFLRALKNELETDSGSIFRYADHENNYLNMIYRQIMADPNEISDRDGLLAFIRMISKSEKNSVEKWEGKRNMIDLCHLVRRYYYHPQTNGSNSIKHVLPAILNSSDYLKTRYSRPIYGSAEGIPSLNFTDKTWVKFEDGNFCDPYKLLDKMFTEMPEEMFDRFSETDELNDGGAAMTAYARLQFEDMSDYERQEIKKALLRYCELDTLAMVMIYEGWREMLKIETISTMP